MEIGRRVLLDIKYNNQNISDRIGPFIESFSYSDNIVGEADDVSLTLADRENKWMGPWMPKKGATLNVSILITNWDTKSKYVGTFEIDEIGISGPPSKVKIESISVPDSSSLRGQEKYRSWEKTVLRKVLEDVAKQNKLNLYFDSNENPEMDRVEQAGETDLRFVMRLCQDHGLALKVTRTQLIVLDEERLERADISGTFSRLDRNILEYDGKTTTNGTYRACRVEYTPAKAKKPIIYTFTPPNAPKTGRILVIREQVDSQKEAMLLAKKRLRAENKDETTFMLRYAGVTNYYAGQTVQLKDFGAFDGKYIITKMVVEIGKKSETTFTLRKVLEGY